MKPLCEICGERHESYQAHVFATNRIATNEGLKKRLTDATNSVRDEQADEAVREEVGELPGSGVRKAEALVGSNAVGTQTKNRRSREAYNSYQRQYMRSYRERKRNEERS